MYISFNFYNWFTYYNILAFFLNGSNIFVFPAIPNALINPFIFIVSLFLKSSIELFPGKSLYCSSIDLNESMFLLYDSTVGFVSTITVLSSSSFVAADFGCAVKLCLFDLIFDVPLIIASVTFLAFSVNSAGCGEGCGAGCGLGCGAGCGSG